MIAASVFKESMPKLKKVKKPKKVQKYKAKKKGA